MGEWWIGALLTCEEESVFIYCLCHQKFIIKKKQIRERPKGGKGGRQETPPPQDAARGRPPGTGDRNGDPTETLESGGSRGWGAKVRGSWPPPLSQKQRAGLGRWAGSRQVPVRPCTPGGQHTWEPLSSARGPSQAWKEQTEAGLERARLFLREREKGFWASAALLLPTSHPPPLRWQHLPRVLLPSGPEGATGPAGARGEEGGGLPKVNGCAKAPNHRLFPGCHMPLGSNPSSTPPSVPLATPSL